MRSWWPTWPTRPVCSRGSPPTSDVGPRRPPLRVTRRARGSSNEMFEVNVDGRPLDAAPSDQDRPGRRRRRHRPGVPPAHRPRGHPRPPSPSRRLLRRRVRDRIALLPDGPRRGLRADRPAAASPSSPTRPPATASASPWSMPWPSWPWWTGRAGASATSANPTGFHERQVRRWRGQLESYRWRDLPHVDSIEAWLTANQPTSFVPGIMHGDYHQGNVLMAPGPAGARRRHRGLGKRHHR